MSEIVTIIENAFLSGEDIVLEGRTLVAAHTVEYWLDLYLDQVDENFSEADAFLAAAETLLDAATTPV